MAQYTPHTWHAVGGWIGYGGVSDQRPCDSEAEARHIAQDILAPQHRESEYWTDVEPCTDTECEVGWD